MCAQLDLTKVDVDGAVREAADAVSGDTRLAFLRRAGITGATALSGGALLGALLPSGALAATGNATGHGRPAASFGAGDVGIFNYALTLEYLEATFYAQAVSKISFTDPHLKALAKVIAGHEAMHVAYLKKALGSSAIKEPKFDFASAVTDQATFTATSQTLENTGVGAYFGQAFNISKAADLAAAVSVLTVEARHAGAIGYYNDKTAKDISPSGAFDKPLTAAKVLTAVDGTKFIV